MAKLILPIPSPVPLSVLNMWIDALLERIPTKRPYSSTIVTRLANVCQKAGIDQVWMLAIHPPLQLCSLNNCMHRTVNFAEQTLGLVGCRLDMFPELRGAMEDVTTRCRETSRLHWLTRFECFMALAGRGHWAIEPVIIEALAEYGLRPGMPLEELFVYDPSLAAPVEPKELTVAEEILAFGALQATEAFPSEQIIGGLTVIELMAQLAVSSEPNLRDRSLFIVAMWHHLSPRALKKLGIAEGK